MPVSASTVWEVRTDGNAANGGGFVTGATGQDFSLQPGAQYPLTGVTSAGAGDTVLHVSAADDMVGNIAKVISGTNFTTGYFQVISVVPGVSITFSTNRSSASICTGIGALGVINIGGATDLLSTITLNPQLGNIIYVKAGTYVKTSTESFTFTGTTNSDYISVVGYNTTRSLGVNSDTKPVFTSATNSVAVMTLALCQRLRFFNIRVTHTAATRGNGWVVITNTSNASWENCECDGCLTGWTGGTSATIALIRGVWVNCIARNCITNGWEQLGSSGVYSWTLIGCIGISNGSHGFALGASQNGTTNLCQSCIFAKNGGDGVNTVAVAFGSFVILQNCILAGNANSGYRTATTSTSTDGPRLHIYNCIIHGNTVYGLQCPTASAAQNPGIFLRNNAYGANGADTLNVTDTNGKVTLLADPFTDSANNDYTLNDAAGGGPLLQGVGVPRTIGSNTYAVGTNTLDIGAFQDSELVYLVNGGNGGILGG